MSKYMTSFEWEKRKARNNRILGFVVGVLSTLGALIIGSLL